MIAVGTSALMAIVLDEPAADACSAALAAEDELLISAGTVAEALIVSARVGKEVAGLIDGLGFDVVEVTVASARRIAQPMKSGGKVRIPRPSILVTASPMRLRSSVDVACSMSATTSPKPMSRAFFRGSLPAKLAGSGHGTVRPKAGKRRYR